MDLLLEQKLLAMTISDRVIVAYKQKKLSTEFKIDLAGVFKVRGVKMSKVGRNEDCPCGSKKKHKKCCLARDIIIPQQSIKNDHQSERILIKTLTDELFQPMRLYYIVHDKAHLETCFKSLRCLKYDEKLNDWVVEYRDEAADLKLGVKPEKVPKEAQPLIIATIYIENETTMLVDIRSIERAKKLIEFIDIWVPRTAAEITHAAIYNQLITTSRNKTSKELSDIDYDDIFNQKNIFVVDPDRAIHDAEEIAKKHKNKNEKLHAIMEKVEENSKKQLPKVEKLPIHFYEEGINTFSMACQMRQMIAMKHYYGDINYSFYDLTQELVKNSNGSKIKRGWIKKQKSGISGDPMI